MLPILTGNVGINGGNSGARESTYTLTIERLPVLVNPVKTAISCFSWTDAIARGPEMTALRDGVRGKDKLDVPIKFIWNYAGIPSSTSILISTKPTKFSRTRKNAK
jgi:Tat-targeted selenate reductase subunit YnfE